MCIAVDAYIYSRANRKASSLMLALSLASLPSSSQTHECCFCLKCDCVHMCHCVYTKCFLYSVVAVVAIAAIGTIAAISVAVFVVVVGES